LPALHTLTLLETEAEHLMNLNENSWRQAYKVFVNFYLH